MKYEITFILPCLNEENSLGYCIEEIKNYIQNNKINAEILVADNGSIDKSKEIAKEKGARIEECKEKGYGNALIYGTQKAQGKYCIMGDSDGSYDFEHVDEFIKYLREGYDLVVGNRFNGGIQKGAMKLSHKIGVKFLTWIANVFFDTPIKDYHCGLRAYNTEKLKKLQLSQGGMEFASEMIILAKINNLKLKEVPTILKKDLRGRKSHLRTIRDGIRHLILIIRMFINRKKYKRIEKNEKDF